MADAAARQLQYEYKAVSNCICDYFSLMKINNSSKLSTIIPVLL